MSTDAIIDDVMEHLCIALKKRHCVVYMYPVDIRLARAGAKVCTRDGQTVHHLREVKRANDTILVGRLAHKDEQWDIAGRYVDPYHDDAKDLYIPERFFDPNWKEHMDLNNEQWEEQFGKEHPYCTKPKTKDHFEEYTEIPTPTFDENEI